MLSWVRWAHLATVMALGAALVWSVLDAAGVRTELAQAQAAAAAQVASAAEVAASSVQTARMRELAATTASIGIADDLHQRLADRDRRISDLDERLRQQFARPVRLCRAGPGAPAAAASGGDAAGPAGLPGLAGEDLVIVDSTARAELAQLAVSAGDTANTLKACRALLREQWQATQ